MAETLTIRTASSTEVVKIAVPGPQGATGQGVPVGGSTGQVLRKKTSTDYDTEWAAAGSGSGSVTSVALASTDLTISGSPITDSGTITANIAANAVTLEKLQTISSEHLLGRHGNGNGGVQQVGLGTGLAMSGSNIQCTVTAPTASSATPSALGTAAAGSATDYARADHIHSAEVSDSAFRVTGSTDATKKVALEVDTNVPANTTVTLTAPSASGTLALAGAAPSAHAASHAAAGSDPLAPSDIGAQSLFTPQSQALSADVTLTSGRAVRLTLENYNGTTYNVTLPTTGNQTGDVFIIRTGTLVASQTIRRENFSGNFTTLATISSGQSYRFITTGTTSGSWQIDPVFTHTHAASDITSGAIAHERGGLEADVSAYNGLVKISGGSTSAVGIGTGSTEVAAGDHGHGNITSDGKIGSTAGLPVVTTTAGAVTTLALGTANQVLRVNSGASGVEFADPAASGVTGAASSASDVLGVSGANITGVDANADRIIFFDDSAGKLTHLTVGSGLSISDTTISATATGTIGGSTSTDNAIVRGDSTSNTVQDSAFIIADNATASPNNTVNHASIQATGGTTNVSVSIVPKGTGALSLHVPDATATGGNVRGANAVDLQTVRDAAAKVASGAQSAIIGGRDNTASGSGGVIAAGYACTVSQSYAFIGGGFGQSVSGLYGGVVGGRDANVSGAHAAAIGSSGPVCSGTECVVVSGLSSQATAQGATAFSYNALANRIRTQAYAAGQFAAVGDAQRIRAVLRCKTTTNAAVEMALDGGTTYLTIPSGKVIFCNIKVVGVKSDGSVVATYERQYAAKNVAGTSSEVFAEVTIGTDNASSTSLDISTVDAGDYISIKPTGIASETWRWVASVDAVEVAYGS